MPLFTLIVIINNVITVIFIHKIIITYRLHSFLQIYFLFRSIGIITCFKAPKNTPNHIKIDNISLFLEEYTKKLITKTRIKNFR